MCRCRYFPRLIRIIIILLSGYRVTGFEDKDRCETVGSGDSGGPLVCRESPGSAWFHLGVVSWSLSTCDVDRLTPDVYASTVSVRDWVVKTMDNNLSVMEQFEQLLLEDQPRTP